MIEYLEIRDANRELIGIFDEWNSVIWETDYYGTGSFEIYAPATANNMAMLKVGNYVNRIDDDNIGVFENVGAEYDVQTGRMISAKGRFVKSLLDRRLVYKLNTGTAGKISISPTVSRGKVEEAARKLVNDHIISSKYPARNVDFIQLGELKGITTTIVDEDGDPTSKQTSYGNLLTYTDEMLQEYELGAFMRFDRVSKNFLYEVYQGADRTRNNTDGNRPVIFSQDFDNLLASTYNLETDQIKNTALIGGEGQGAQRFCAMVGVNATGLNRKEVWLDASSQSKTYEDDNGEQAEYDDETYLQMLKSAGLQRLASLQITETYDGTLDMTLSQYLYKRDFNVGDVVSIEDIELGIYFNPRVLSVIESQDEQGYNIFIKYGN